MTRGESSARTDGGTGQEKAAKKLRQVKTDYNLQFWFISGHLVNLEFATFTFHRQIYR